MMNEEDQRRLYPRLERLTRAQLVELWDRCGVEFASPEARKDALRQDAVWLIGPLLADVELKTLVAELERLEEGRQ